MQKAPIRPKQDDDLLFDPETTMKSQYSSNQDTLNLSLPFESDSKNFLSPSLLSPTQNPPKLNSNFFSNMEGESFEKDKLDNLLNLCSYDSYMTSEELLMNEDINFLYEKSSEKPSSCITTSLNYSKSDTESSVFDTIRFSNAFELSMPHAYNSSKYFSTLSFETQNPEDTTERIDLNYEPSDRYKKRMQKALDKTKSPLKPEKAINTDGSDLSETHPIEPSVESVNKKPGPEEDTVCCKSCSIF